MKTKIVLLLISMLAITGCTNKLIVKDPTDKQAVLDKIYEVKSEFGEDRVFGPKIEKDFSGVLIGDWLHVQLMKAEDSRYYVVIENKYGGDWKFLESITTLEKETIPLQSQDRQVDTCGEVCYHTEIGIAPVDKARYLTGNIDFKFRINGKRGEMVVVIPKEYIQAFLARAK